MTDGSSLIGKQIGNYRIVAELARGSFGSVYQAQHTILSERTVAIKLLHAHLDSSTEQNSFLQEARFLEKLKHHHILSIFDVGFSDGFPYLMAEYASGGSLRDRLKRQASRPLPVEEALIILSQIGQALQYAHLQKIIHRDLKPENILFNATGEALLADFGVATMLATTSIKHATAISGTPLYMAPEQFQGTISKESDQYALGCIAYELFTGHKPFFGSDLVSLMFKHVEEALSAYEEALKLDNNHAPALYGKGQVLHAQGKLKQGIDLLDWAIKSDPNFVKAWTRRGSLLEELGELKAALSSYDQALRNDSRNVPALNGKAGVLRQLERYEEALQTYQYALSIDPNSAAVWNGMGNILYVLRKYQEALSAYDRALQLNPQLASVWYNKSLVLSRVGHHEAALQAAEEAIRLRPSDLDYWLRKAEALKKLHRREDARLAEEEAARLRGKQQ